MGPLARRLASRGSSGKAVGEVPRSEWAAHPPSRRDGRERLKHKGAVFEAARGNVQHPGWEAAAAPQTDVEVENARGPMLAAPPAELLLDLLDTPQHLERIQVAFDESDGIGKIATRAADSGVEDDGRRVKQGEFFIEPCDCSFDDLGWPSVLAVGPIRSNRDRVEVRCISHRCSPRS